MSHIWCFKYFWHSLASCFSSLVQILQHFCSFLSWEKQYQKGRKQAPLCLSCKILSKRCIQCWSCSNLYSWVNFLLFFNYLPTNVFFKVYKYANYKLYKISPTEVLKKPRWKKYFLMQSFFGPSARRIQWIQACPMSVLLHVGSTSVTSFFQNKNLVTEKTPFLKWVKGTQNGVFRSFCKILSLLFAGRNLKWKTLHFSLFLCKPHIWQNLPHNLWTKVKFA